MHDPLAHDAHPHAHNTLGRVARTDTTTQLPQRISTAYYIQPIKHYIHAKPLTNSN
jgi:hypothetical protein